jgi:uncharacterized membrane protein
VSWRGDEAQVTAVTDERGNRMHQLRHSEGWIFGTMLFSACCSLIASFVLSVDAIDLARDPGAKLTCNINSVISCGQVGLSWQASLFGFPNAFLGLIAESVVITIAVALLGGVRFPRWFMASAQVVYTLGLIFAYWLFSQSMLVIHALCPWCLVITLSTTLVFWSLTHYNLREGNLFLPAGLERRGLELVRSDNDVYIVAAWLTLLVALILLKYGAAVFA